MVCAGRLRWFFELWSLYWFEEDVSSSLLSRAASCALNLDCGESGSGVPPSEEWEEARGGVAIVISMAVIVLTESGQRKDGNNEQISI